MSSYTPLNGKLAGRGRSEIARLSLARRSLLRLVVVDAVYDHVVARQSWSANFEDGVAIFEVGIRGAGEGD